VQNAKAHRRFLSKCRLGLNHERIGKMASEPELLKISTNGLDFAVWHWPGSSKQQYFFVHATGFHARCWDQIIARLAENDCFAMDLRGHGLSAKTDPPLKWRDAGSDAAGVASALGIQNAIGIGHSMGGHSLCVAAANNARMFSCLILIDPVIQKEKYYRSADEPSPDYTTHPVARRRNRWASAQEMYDRYKDRPPFDRWNKAVLKDYCSYALTPANDKEGFVLACTPVFEAAIYAESVAPDALIYEDLKKIEIPVLIMRLGVTRDDSELNFDMSPTNPNLVSSFKNATDIHIPEYTHFMPMENPELVADRIKEFLAVQATRA
jgi:pimeloyl-ACP methyl ester carboxylesterase